MKEEDNILRKVGTGNPFRVPDGYFEELTSQIMDKLPEREKTLPYSKEPTMWDRVKPLLYMAAMFIGAALLIRVGSSTRSADAQAVAADDTDMEMEYIHAAVDNSMMDDYSLYVYLTDADTE